jgi:dTDP-4-amino-4,6-dideoxygalactose transaminase
MTDLSDNYIVFGKPHIGEEEIAEVVDSLKKGWIGTGPKVAAFESAFKDYIGCEHAVALHSCTAGLFLANLALGIGQGDAVITTPLTFVATANAIAHTGAIPLFCDVERESGLLDPKAVQALLEEDCEVDDKDGRPVHKKTGRKVRALLPVHLWGQPCDMNAFRGLAEKYNLFLMEDAAHAIEATYENGASEKIGTTADISCFSFYATKNLCTGEGGMITTANPEWAGRIKTLSLHGLSKDAWSRFSDAGYQHYLASEPGYKFNMMDIQAALGIHQLARLEDMYKVREKQWHAYRQDLAGIDGLVLPPAKAAHGRHARHLFTVEITPELQVERDDFMMRMHEKGVGTGVHYLSLTDHPVYAEANGRPSPNATEIGRRSMSLPLAGALSEDGRKRVVETLMKVIREGRGRR